jgi:poly-gamma-glutamate synthesis protein (capsule biosynthesis protein)
MTVNWCLGAVGDVFVNRPNPQHAFRHGAPVLRSIDLVFGNCEGAYTDAPHYAPSAGWRVVSGTANARGLREAGFHVMACANNHSVDAGHEGLAQTLAVLRDQGIHTIGAGCDAAEAYRPAIVEQAGLKIGFLAYSSVYQAGYAARPGLPGIAAMRIHSHYYIPDWDAYGRVEPGAVPQIRTFAYPEDVSALQTAIANARQSCDVVVASFHWGTARVPAVLTDYEITLGRAAIDFGADIVLGHHHHFLRGIELYRGRPIFYGLGHFVFDLPGLEQALSPHDLAKLHAMGEYAIYPRAGFPLSPFHPDARMTMIAVAQFEGAALSAAGFIPCLINLENHAVPLPLDSGDGGRVLQYMREITAAAGLSTQYVPGEKVAGFRSAMAV